MTKNKIKIAGDIHKPFSIVIILPKTRNKTSSLLLSLKVYMNIRKHVLLSTNTLCMMSSAFSTNLPENLKHLYLPYRQNCWAASDEPRTMMRNLKYFELTKILVYCALLTTASEFRQTE